ncbi:Ig-like domain-containing protein [Rhizobium sp.]
MASRRIKRPTIDLKPSSDSGESASDNITSDVTPTLGGKAKPGSRIFIMDGDHKIGAVTAGKSGHWSFTARDLDDGSHELTAVIGKGAKAVASKILDVTVDSKAPSAPLIDLADQSDSGASSFDNITDVTIPLLTGFAEAGSTVTIMDGATTLGTVTASANGTWTFTTSTLADGVHNLTAGATDRPGNASILSVPLSVTIDTSAPDAPTIGLDAGSDTGTSSTDMITGDNTPTLYGTAEPGATVIIKDGNTTIATITADAAGDWAFITKTLADGTHDLTAIATDAAGNTGPASAVLSITIDATSATPTMDLVDASDSGASATDNITNVTTPTLSGTAEAGASVVIRDGSIAIGTAIADSAGLWTFTTSALGDGGHSFTAIATDSFGNVSQPSAALVLTIDTTAAANPTLALVNDDGTTGDLLTTDTRLKGTADPYATIGIYIDADGLDGTTTADADGNWTYTPPAGLFAGQHYFTATATDLAGNLNATFDYTVITVSSRIIYDLRVMPPSQGFVLQGDVAYDFFGHAVASAGDIDGDGLADLVIGADADNDGGEHSGAAYVMFGKAWNFGIVDGAGRQIVDMTSLSGFQGFIVQGDSTWDFAGRDADSAGDVNGDGFDDFIVGALGSDGGNTAGEAYVLFGGASGFGTSDSTGRQVIDLTYLSATQGFIIQGDTAGEFAGGAVSSAGDINGDGFDDILVGAYNRSVGQSGAGAAYVIFGSASGFGTPDGAGRRVIDTTFLSAAQGFIIQGAGNNDHAGRSVSSAGDINGDGFDDILVGASGVNTGGTVAGAAYILFGGTVGFGTADGTGRQVVNVGSLSAEQGFIIQGDATGDVAGISVGLAGDVNGDGFDDIIVGASHGSDGGRGAGEAYVIFGSASGFGTTNGSGQNVIDLTSLSAGQGFIIQGDRAGDYAGYGVSSAGDFNGDGFDDLLVGAKGNDNGGGWAGEAYVVFGSASGFGAADSGGRQVIDLTTLTPAQGVVIRGDAANNQTGRNVSSAGDVNGDGFDDVIVSANYGSAGGTFAGQAYVIYGSAVGSSSTAITLSGTSAAETLIGGRGADILSGGGGADVLIGGNGSDVISIADASFARIRGGGGVDTLAFSGAGMNVDFTTISDSRISGIERLDITGTGDNTATLSASDLFDFSTTKDAAFSFATVDEALIVLGNVGDVLNLEDTALGVTGAWTKTASDVGLDGADGGGYDIYTYSVSNATRGFIAVDADVTVNLI